MTALWLFVRAELRRRWQAIVVLSLLVGVGGGVALTALAGAVRTDRAVPEMVAYSRPDNGGFGYGDLTGPGHGSTLDLLPGEQRVANLPEVAAWFRLPSVELSVDRSGQSSSGLDVMASPDGAFFHNVDRPMVLAGHLPAASDPFDVAINQFAASRLHLHVGSPLRVYSYSAAQIAASAGPDGSSEAMAPAGPALDLKVVGVYRLPRGVSPVEPYAARQDVSYESKAELYLPPSFLPEMARRLGMPVQAFPQMNLIAVRLRHGLADFPAFAADAARVGGDKVFVGDSGNVMGTDAAAASAARGTRLESISLLAFGLVAALITVLLVGQAVARQIILRADDHSVLQSLGATRRELFGAALIPAGVVGLLGVVIAFAIAVAASPLMPIGLARQAELHPGVDVDLPVLLGGAFAVCVLIVVWSVPAVWRTNLFSASGRGAGRASSAISGWARALRSPAAGVGLLFGLRRGAGGRAVPIGSALLAAVVAVAALTASLTFGASLSHLEASPHEQGWNWDVLVGNPADFTDREAQYSKLLSQNSLVDSYSAVAIIAGAQQGNSYIGQVALNQLLAFDPLKGSVLPVLVQGRAPQGLHEIVLGTRTLAKLHKKVGDLVQQDLGPPVGKIDLRVVGAMIAPSVGDIFTNSLGDGGWISASAVKTVQGQLPPSGGDSSGPPPTTFALFAVRFAPGVSPDAAFASLRREFGPVVLRRLPPADVIDLSSVRQLPVILAGLIGLLGLGTIGHTLVTSVRLRRRDLALLKTMGFVRRQVAATVAWQATSFAVIALVSGVPLGLAAGRWAWLTVASGINSVSPAVVPVTTLALIVPAALLMANLLAAGPGWVAARVAPAVVLREE